MYVFICDIYMSNKMHSIESNTTSTSAYDPQVFLVLSLQGNVDAGFSIEDKRVFGSYDMASKYFDTRVHTLKDKYSNDPSTDIFSHDEETIRILELSYGSSLHQVTLESLSLHGEASSSY